MKFLAVLMALALLCVAAIVAQHRGGVGKKVGGGGEPPAARQAAGANSAAPVEVRAAVERGARWLASVQGADGGWGQDGGAASHNRQGVSLESKGNDVANTAVAALALLRSGGQYRPNVERAVDFILRKIETSPADGLSITDVNQTQIQRKLGPYIDTFLASVLLAEVEGMLAGGSKVRARRGLEKCVAKIERNQLKDGSWNVGGGWAPVLGTSLASRSLYEAAKNGIKVDGEVMAKAEAYTIDNQKSRAASADSGRGVGAGVGRGAADAASLRSVDGLAASVPLSAAAGVELYQDAQALEQLSRTEADRRKNATEIRAINRKLADAKFVAGYGSIGGEEFFSYLNISDGLKRAGGKEWGAWYAQITAKILKLQNNDGTWAGHHCITGRVAVTGAAILNLTAAR